MVSEEKRVYIAMLRKITVLLFGILLALSTIAG